MTQADLVIAGALGGTNIGDSLLYGAQRLGVTAVLQDTRLAHDAPSLLQRAAWHLLERRPARLGRYNESLIQTCEQRRPRWLIAVGIAPITAATLQRLRHLGVESLNFLTDDPFNPAHRSTRALRATAAYDIVVSPRRANMADLNALGCRAVTYLPFGYDERYFFRDDSASHTDELSSDAIFVGAGDADRVPWINAMFAAGIDVALYGSFWDRFPETRGRSRGQVDPDTLRRATRAARTAVCLVRRANRDGHVMRSFEIPAIGTCMVAEDTDEHRSIFGPEGRSVLYFDSPEIMVERVRTLLDNSMERERLASAAHSLIVNGKHTYTDRLHSMIAMLER